MHLAGTLLDPAEVVVICFSMTSNGPASILLDLTSSPSLSDSAPTKASRGKPQPSVLSQAPLLRWVLTLSFLVATVAVGLYAM